jgi:transposase
MSDVKTIEGFIKRMKKYGCGRIRMLLDRGFYSGPNIRALLDAHVGFLMPVPANIKSYQALVDGHRDNLEMPENIIKLSNGGKDAVYGMTVLGRVGQKRIWQHIYFDTARRHEHILSLFSDLARWEEELVSGNVNEANSKAYDHYFTVKTTPKRGRQVKRNQEAINEYKTDRAGYWVIITNCEKDAASALLAYKERSLVESQFDDLKNELDMARIRTHGKDTMRGRVLVQFLALILCSQIRNTLDDAWARRGKDKDNGFSRRYTLSEMMLRLGSYRKTRFSGHYGEVLSTPTKAQRQLFAAFGLLDQVT